ncbi:MAG: ABC transporter ATP-binding protein [Desulfovibrionales bacterium]|nr:ABC transporter ATP-binding protein [Desulfovibrionales bacterium]
MEQAVDVELQNLSFDYGGQSILKDVSLNIPRGEFASIVGPNGGGKTTLLRLILGLESPSRGNIFVLGQSPHRVRNSIGYMPQYAHLDISCPANVMDVTLMGRLKKGLFRYSKKDKDAALEALVQVKMDHGWKDNFHTLSGGQKQRVLIARALCSHPEILLLDEPTANVDQETEKNLFSILKTLNEKMTILLVSHDLGFVSHYVKSVICVNQRVVIHPTSTVDGNLIKDIYNGDLKMVRHDHRCSQGGHRHD